MIKKILAILFVCTFLSADYVDDLIQNAKTLTKSKEISKLNKAYSIYEKALKEALKNKSNSQTYEILESLVSLGKKLGQNTSDYKAQFSKLVLPVFKSYQIKDGELILRFNSNLKNSYYRFFRFSPTRFIVDVYSDFKQNPIRAKNTSFAASLVIAKNKRALTRIVIDTKEPVKHSINVWKNALIIKEQTNANSKLQNELFSQEKITKTPKQAQEKSVFLSAMDKKIIVLDPGHGGKDSGAVGVCKLHEKTLVLSVSKILEKLLKQKGYKVYTTRNTDKYVELTDRTSFANKKNAHIFISIHGNSMPVASKTKGIETYFLSSAKTQKAKQIAEQENAVDLKAMEAMSKLTFLNFLNREKIVSSNKLAIDLQKELLKTLRQKYKYINDGGVRQGPFWVLVGAQMPAVLVEIGFLSNKFECQRLKQKSYQTQIAKGMALGIDSFFRNNKAF